MTIKTGSLFKGFFLSHTLITNSISKPIEYSELRAIIKTMPLTSPGSTVYYYYVTFDGCFDVIIFNHANKVVQYVKAIGLPIPAWSDLVEPISINPPVNKVYMYKRITIFVEILIFILTLCLLTLIHIIIQIYL